AAGSMRAARPVRGVGPLARHQRRHGIRVACRRWIRGMNRPHLFDAGALAELAAPPDTTLPNGLAAGLAAAARRSRDGRLMLGGSPPRLLRLSKPAARILEPGRFTVADTATAVL